MRLSKRGYPQKARPRHRFRRPNHLQDTVVLELEVPASMIPWLEGFQDWSLGGVEGAAVYLLTTALMKEQELMWNGRSVHGGRAKMGDIQRNVTVFLAEPVNCGPTLVEAEAFRATLAEIHGARPQDGKGGE